MSLIWRHWSAGVSWLPCYIAPRCCLLSYVSFGILYPFLLCYICYKQEAPKVYSKLFTPFWMSAAAAAKSLQSCPTLCDPIDGSPPGSPVPGILQARTLEWVAISFSNAWKWKVKAKSFSHVWLLVTPWTAAYQAPLPMGFSRQEYWSGVPLPSPFELLLFCYYSSMVIGHDRYPMRKRGKKERKGGNEEKKRGQEGSY